MNSNGGETRNPILVGGDPEGFSPDELAESAFDRMFLLDMPPPRRFRERPVPRIPEPVRRAKLDHEGDDVREGASGLVYEICDDGWVPTAVHIAAELEAMPLKRKQRAGQVLSSGERVRLVYLNKIAGNKWKSAWSAEQHGAWGQVKSLCEEIGNLHSSHKDTARAVSDRLDALTERESFPTLAWELDADGVYWEVPVTGEAWEKILGLLVTVNGPTPFGIDCDVNEL